MYRFVQHLDRDTLSFSVSVQSDILDDISAFCLLAFRVDIHTLFACNNPEQETPRKLLSNINNHIINTFVSERKSILDELYPDLDFPPNFWRSIYIDFEFGDVHYRVLHHYHQWTVQQSKYKTFPAAFFLSTTEFLSWCYMILLLFHVVDDDSDHHHIVTTAFILTAVQCLHLCALYLSVTQIFALLPTLKAFNQYLKDRLDLRSDLLYSDTQFDWIWILTLSVQKYLNLSYPLKPIEMTSPQYTLSRYIPSSVLQHRVVVPLRNRYVLLMATFKYLFGVMLSLMILNNFQETTFYALFNVVFFCSFILLQMLVFGVIMITNYAIPPMTALTVILMAVSCSLLAYGLIVIILYFADRQVLEQTANDEHNWLTDTMIPTVFMSCWMVTVYKVYLNWNGYHQWLWMVVSMCCLYEIFQVSALWIVPYHKDVVCCGTFMLLMATVYIEYQHRMHHAFTCLKHRHYVSEYIANHNHRYR